MGRHNHSQMPASPQQEDAPDKYDVDVEENDQPNAEEVDATAPPGDAQPAKRGRGRPKGSKNKKSGAAPPTVDTSEGVPVKRKRGRPPKEKKQDESGAEEPPAKRSRGRPRKEQKPQEAATAATSTSAPAEGAGEPTPKKKRGRPPKKI